MYHKLRLHCKLIYLVIKSLKTLLFYKNRSKIPKTFNYQNYNRVDILENLNIHNANEIKSYQNCIKSLPNKFNKYGHSLMQLQEIH